MRHWHQSLEGALTHRRKSYASRSEGSILSLISTKCSISNTTHQKAIIRQIISSFYRSTFWLVALLNKLSVQLYIIHVIWSICVCYILKNSCILQVFHVNNGNFLIEAGTSNSHATDPVLLRLVQFYRATSFCLRLSRSFTALTEINCGNSISWTAKRRKSSNDALAIIHVIIHVSRCLKGLRVTL